MVGAPGPSAPAQRAARLREPKGKKNLLLTFLEDRLGIPAKSPSDARRERAVFPPGCPAASILRWKISSGLSIGDGAAPLKGFSPPSAHGGRRAMRPSSMTAGSLSHAALLRILRDFDTKRRGSSPFSLRRENGRHFSAQKAHPSLDILSSLDDHAL
jgi:hypothetical protein